MAWRQSVTYPSGLDPKHAGAPGRTRTSNPQIRSLVLYPIELRAQRRRGDVAYAPARRNPYRLASGGTKSGAVSQGNSTHVSCGTSTTQVSATFLPAGLA